jgi:protein TonB
MRLWIVATLAAVGSLEWAQADAQASTASKTFAATQLKWIETPTAVQFAALDPADHRPGVVELNCTLVTGGRLSDCMVVSETPARKGFGEAAQKLSRYFRAAPTSRDGQTVEGGTVNLTIRFNVYR